MPIKVLIVDDNEKVVKSLAEFLETLSNIHVVGTARTKNEAEMIASSSSVDIAILDYLLADCTGLDVASSLKTIDPSIKFIILSVVEHCQDDTHLENLGVLKWFTKSEDLASFSNFLQNLVNLN